MGRIRLTEDQCNKIYDILIEIGAEPSNHSRNHFIQHFTSDDIPHEWRFMGKLGFGGKLRYLSSGELFLYVDYYPEHKSEARDKIAEEANLKLRPIADDLNQMREDMIRERLKRCRS